MRKLKLTTFEQGHIAEQELELSYNLLNFIP